MTKLTNNPVLMALACLILTGCNSVPQIPKGEKARSEFLDRHNAKHNLKIVKTDNIEELLSSHKTIALLPVIYEWEEIEDSRYGEVDISLREELDECRLSGFYKGNQYYPGFFDMRSLQVAILQEAPQSPRYPQMVRKPARVSVQDYKTTYSILDQFDLTNSQEEKYANFAELTRILNVDAILRIKSKHPLIGISKTEPEKYDAWKKKARAAAATTNTLLRLATGNVVGAAVSATGGLVSGTIDAKDGENCFDIFKQHVLPKNYLCPHESILLWELADSDQGVIWSGEQSCEATANTRKLENRFKVINTRGDYEDESGNTVKEAKAIDTDRAFWLLGKQLPYESLDLK